ncbi:hypothetical protein AZI11_07910 [Levilactobacillus brevis]|nr:hypothetical protein AZI11_07910 [Levilactobacillus brevis]ARN95482.1 hypothetical protein AZI12_07960 [Levilactobacillus brevis]
MVNAGNAMMINNQKERVVSELLAKKVMLNCVAIFVFMGGLMLKSHISANVSIMQSSWLEVIGINRSFKFHFKNDAFFSKY